MSMKVCLAVQTRAFATDSIPSHAKDDVMPIKSMLRTNATENPCVGGSIPPLATIPFS
jgi:hypothetical protein